MFEKTKINEKRSLTADFLNNLSQTLNNSFIALYVYRVDIFMRLTFSASSVLYFFLKTAFKLPTNWTKYLIKFFFKNGPFRPLFCWFLSFLKLTFSINFCLWLDSNHGSLVLEATTLPTEPQPLPPTFT